MYRLPLVVFLLLAGLASAQISPALPASNQAEADGIRLEFPNADVRGVLEFYGRLTRKRVVIDNLVEGTVNIVAGGEVSREEAIRIIEVNLLLNGVTLIPVDRSDIVKVIAAGKNARTSAIPIVSDELSLPDGDQVVTYIARLRYVDPQELQQILSSYIGGNQSQYTNLTPLPNSQALLITENSSTIRSLLRVVHEIDAPPAEVVSEFIPLARADAKDVLEKLNGIFEKSKTPHAALPGIPPPAPTTPDGKTALTGATAEMTSADSLEIRGGALSEDSVITGKIKLTADVRTNRIHVVTRPVNMPFVRKLIQQFDSAISFGEPVSRPLRYISAADVLDVLVKSITEPGMKEDNASNGSSRGPSSNRSNTASAAPPVSSSSNGSSNGSTVNVTEGLSTEPVDTTPEARVIGTTKLIADKNANAIIVIANAAVRTKVLRLLDELDQRIPQVMLSTLIGELSLDKTDQFGVDYIIKNSGLGVSPLVFNTANGNSTGATTSTVAAATGTGAAANAATLAATGSSTGVTTGSTTTTTSPFTNTPSSFVNFGSNNHPALNLNNILDVNKATQIATAGGGGFTGLFTAGNSFNAIVTALQSTNHFHVVSRPCVFTRNNKKALIASGQEIAVPTLIASSLGNAGSANGLVTNSSVDYKTVALQLEVVPLINSDKEISLDILQKEDEVAGSTTIDGNSIPTIATRYVKTSVTVPNNGTLVLGGLIKVSQNDTKSGIPILSDIPYIGALFSTKSKEKIRTELVILIHPVVSWAPPDFKKIREGTQQYMELEPDLENALLPTPPIKKKPRPTPRERDPSTSIPLPK